MRRLWKGLPFLLLTLAFARIAPSIPVMGATGDSALTAKGELLKVDTTNHTFTIKAANGEEMQFSYDSSTKVEGSTEGVQGLSSRTGSRLTVHYKEESGRRLATGIEIEKS